MNALSEYVTAALRGERGWSHCPECLVSIATNDSHGTSCKLVATALDALDKASTPSEPLDTVERIWPIFRDYYLSKTGLDETKAALATELTRTQLPQQKSATPGPTQILPYFFIGGVEDAATWGGPKIAVHEAGGTPGSIWVPIMVGKREEDFHADRKMLDAAALVVATMIKRGEVVLLYCGHGIERSPLAAAWYLKKFQHARSIDAAYGIIEEKRPQIQRRTHWLAANKEAPR